MDFKIDCDPDYILNYFGTTIATLWSLFGDDCRIVIMPKSADFTCSILSAIVFFLFILDFILSLMSREDYFNSFYFYMDIFSMTAILPDKMGVDPFSTSSSNLTIFKASRIGRIGARFGRLVKVIRLLRLLRVLNLLQMCFMRLAAKKDGTGSSKEVETENYSMAYSAKIKGNRRRNGTTSLLRSSSGLGNGSNVQLKRRKSSAKEGGVGFQNINQEEISLDSQSLGDDDTSNIGRALSDLTSKRVIVGVLIMIFVIPFLTLSIDDNSELYALNQIHSNTVLTYYSQYNTTSYYVTKSIYELSISRFLMDFGSALYLNVNNSDIRLNNVNAINNLRDDEISKFSSISTLNFPNSISFTVSTEIWISTRAENYQIAIDSIGVIIFLICVLGIATTYFSKDAHELIINPIERMLFFVRNLFQVQIKKFTNVSIAPPKNSINQKVAEEGFEARIVRFLNKCYNFLISFFYQSSQVDNVTEDQQPVETEASSLLNIETLLLEKTLLKLGHLLHMGSGGDRGAKVIMRHLNGNRIDTDISALKCLSYLCTVRIEKFSLLIQYAPCLTLKLLSCLEILLQTSIASSNGRILQNIDDSIHLCFKLSISSATTHQIQSPPVAPHVLDFSSSQNRAPIFSFDCSQNSFTSMTKCLISDEEKCKDAALNYPYISSLRPVNFPIFHEKFTLIKDVTVKDSDAVVFSPKTPMFLKKSLTSPNLENARTISQAASNTKLKTPKNLSVISSATPQADLVIISIVNLITEYKISNLSGSVKKELTNISGLANFDFNLNFGLHGAWAIESVTGSEHKLDAVLFSNKFGITAILNDYCEKYKLPILFTAEFYSCLSFPFRRISRLLDVIDIPGRDQPLFMFTIDIDEFKIASDSAVMTNMDTLIDSCCKKSSNVGSYDFLPGLINVVHSLLEINDTFINSTISIRSLVDMLAEDISRINLISKLSISKGLSHFNFNVFKYFRTIYHCGFIAYISGNWDSAKAFFQLCLLFYPNDVATRNLITYMSTFDLIAPPNWNGLRVI